MPLIAWTDKYSVGISQIDKQHQKLILLLNTLYNAIKERRERDKIEQALIELSDYTRYHFKFEEEIFEEFSYKDKAVHEKEHKALMEKVRGFGFKIKASQDEVTREILKFLKAWINNHILVMDKKFAEDLTLIISKKR